MGKRYFISKFLEQQGFKRVGPFKQLQFGVKCDNWIKGNIKVERNLTFNGPNITILKNHKIIKTFLFSKYQKDKTIEEFETFIRSLNNTTNNNTHQSNTIDIQDLKISIKEFEIGIQSIKDKLQNNEPLDKTQLMFIETHNIL